LHEAFVAGTVVSIDGKLATVAIVGSDMASGTQRKIDLKELLPRSLDRRGVGEMDTLEVLHMASVLNNVEVLFGQTDVTKPGTAPNAVYSSVGPVLIAMNPFCELPLYTAEWQKAYSSRRKDEETRLAPHCYRTAQEAYSRLAEVKHQSVVICGESGAGKTVTNRKMIEYLCKTSKSAKKGTAVDARQITESNVLL
jgi:myosin heavy subunit